MPPLLDDADPTLPLDVLERLKTAEQTAQSNIERINERLEPLMEGLNRRLRSLQQLPQSKLNRLRGLRKLASDAMAVVGDDAACKKGCSHCCHIAVAITQSEAEVIGQAIGRAPQKVKKPKLLAKKDYGYHMPCTFLKDNSCSIYEHRPLACRIHFNLDKDDLLCRLIVGKTVPLPLMNVLPYQVAYIRFSNGEPLADIREYFPAVDQTHA